MPKKSTLAILEEIRQENARRAALTRADLEREYEAVKQGGFDIGDVLEFQADLTGSNQLEYHYELVLEDRNATAEISLIWSTTLFPAIVQHRIFSFPF